MSRYTLRNGIEIDVVCFDSIGNQKNNWESMYYGIDQMKLQEDGLERLLEWGPAGNCIYVSKYFNIESRWLRNLPWNNQGPMEMDKFTRLKDLDIVNLFARTKEELLETKVKFINPILFLELE